MCVCDLSAKTTTYFDECSHLPYKAYHPMQIRRISFHLYSSVRHVKPRYSFLLDVSTSSLLEGLNFNTRSSVFIILAIELINLKV